VIKRSLDGREQILRFVSPGEIFNEIGVFANRPNPATVVALEAAEVCCLVRLREPFQLRFTKPILFA
jgi:CRP-like cAMP-binding protein